MGTSYLHRPFRADFTWIELPCIHFLGWSLWYRWMTTLCINRFFFCMGRRRLTELSFQATISYRSAIEWQYRIPIDLLVLTAPGWSPFAFTVFLGGGGALEFIENPGWRIARKCSFPLLCVAELGRTPRGRWVGGACHCTGCCGVRRRHPSAHQWGRLWRCTTRGWTP